MFCFDKYLGIDIWSTSHEMVQPSLPNDLINDKYENPMHWTAKCISIRSLYFKLPWITSDGSFANLMLRLIAIEMQVGRYRDPNVANARYKIVAIYTLYDSLISLVQLKTYAFNSCPRIYQHHWVILMIFPSIVCHRPSLMVNQHWFS